MSGVEEGGLDPRKPTVMVAALARRKAEAVAGRRPGALILGCDSALELGGLAHGKPSDPDEAAQRWQAMRGSTGILHTGHCLLDNRAGPDGRGAEAVASTSVRFAHISDAEVAAYVASGEPLAVAGGFTLDGLSAPFIEGVDGDPSNVIGLSLPLLRTLLGYLGIDITTLWNRSPDTIGLGQ